MVSPYIISVVVPCYNEEAVIETTINVLSQLANEFENYTFEFIFVDDGSSDNTLDILRAACMRDKRIRVISFTRNFGHQIAVTAGIDVASGNAIALIDADLQDPPKVLCEMIEKWHGGYDVVYGVRRSRRGESTFKLATARFFYRLLNHLSEVPIPLDTGDFRLMDRKVVNVLKQMPERHRFVRGMVAWVGFKQLALPYDRHQRFAGISKYPLRKMLSFATDGILSFSSKPLRLSALIGFMAAILAIIGIIYALLMRLLTSVWVEGWTALIITILFMGGIQLISIGVIGEYIGRIYEEVKGRPLYIIGDRIGFPPTFSKNRTVSEGEESA